MLLRSGLQLARYGLKHLPAQLGPHAAGRQSAESLFYIVVYHGCLANQARIFVNAER